MSNTFIQQLSLELSICISTGFCSRDCFFRRFSFTFLFAFSIEIALFCAIVSWNVCSRLLKRFSLFNLNALQTFLCSASCFCISHSENIVSLDSLIVATVAWNWVTKIKTALFLINSIECFCSIFSILESLLFFFWGSCISENSGIIINFTSSINSVKIVNLRGWNWLNKMSVTIMAYLNLN